MALVSKNFSDIITFTRASSATFTGSNGLIQTTPQSKNLLLWTEAFDNAAWTKGSGGAGSVPVVTANAGIAPDGSTTADRVQFNCVGSTVSDRSLLSNAATVLNTTAYAGSVYVKAFSASEVGKQLRVVVENVSTGQIITLTDAWQRVTLTGTSIATTATLLLETRGTLTANTTADVLVWGAQLEVGSTATDYTKNDGGLFPPRFDYDPVTLAAKGLLIEEQRTNLLTYSEYFDNAAWTKGGATISADSASSPDGNNNADRLVEDTSTGDHRTFQGASFTSGTAYTFSVYAKASGRNLLQLANTMAGGFTSTFDLTAGTITNTSSGTATITNAGNGWYRCSVSNTSGFTGVSNNQIRLVDTGTNTSYTGNGTSGAFIWGAQLEAGSFATSYIPTVASQVTRSADVASVNTLSPWFNASSGSFYAEADITGAPASNRLFEVHDGTDNNRLFTYTVNSSNSTRFHGVAAGASTEAIAASSSPTSGVPFKTAGAFTAGEYAVCYNGGTVATAAPAALPTGLSAMVLGARRSGAQVLNGHLRRLTFYPRRLSNAELQAITA